MMELPSLMQGLSTQNPRATSLFKNCAAQIDGTHTEFVWGNLDNCLVLLVTQYGRVGSLVVAEKEASFSDASREVSYDIKHLLGAGDIETQVAARFLAEKLNLEKPLYLFSSLKNYSADTLKAVAEIFKSNFVR